MREVERKQFRNDRFCVCFDSVSLRNAYFSHTRYSLTLPALIRRDPTSAWCQSDSGSTQPPHSLYMTRLAPFAAAAPAEGTDRGFLDVRPRSATARNESMKVARCAASAANVRFCRSFKRELPDVIQCDMSTTMTTGAAYSTLFVPTPTRAIPSTPCAVVRLGC